MDCCSFSYFSLFPPTRKQEHKKTAKIVQKSFQKQQQIDQAGYLGSILATLGRNLLPTWPSSWLILLLRFSENFKQITHRTPKRAPRPPKTPQTMIFIDFGAPRTPPDYDFLRFGFKVFDIFYPSRLRFFTDVDGTFCSMLCCRFRQESHETPSKLPK